MSTKSKNNGNESQAKSSSKPNKVRLKIDPKKTIHYRQDASVPKSREDKS